MEPVRQTDGPQLAIEVQRRLPPAPVPALKSTPLEVLPAEMVQAAPRAPIVPVVQRREPIERPMVEDDAPIDCGAPADDHEARICRDIGWGEAHDDRYLEAPPADEGY